VNQSITVFNRQRARPVNLPLLRQAIGILLRDLLACDSFLFAVHLVAPEEITRLNQQFLSHQGSTDVISFDYSERRPSKNSNITSSLEGEIFVCVEEAVTQARKFRVSWQRELARYAIHGILHLCGYDDLRPMPRRQMKREEDRLLRALARKIPLQQFAKRKQRPASRRSL
jgi:rRNA maturation RNase YbeY